MTKLAHGPDRATQNRRGPSRRSQWRGPTDGRSRPGRRGVL